MEPYCLQFHLDSLRNRNGSFLILLSRILTWVKTQYGIQIFRVVVIITLLGAESWESQRSWNMEPARACWDWAIKLNGTFISADKQHATIAPDLKKALTECSLHWTSCHTWKDRGTRLRITSDTPTPPKPLEVQCSWQVTPPVNQESFTL